MLCRKSVSTDDTGSMPVYLNVYDLTPYNGYAYWLGLGVYHSGVQVHGIEYAFGAHEYPTTGIFEGEPKKCEGFTFRKAILIGKTDVGPLEVRTVMEQLAEQYRGNAYNLITKNCNHFCNDACMRLTGNPIPNWVNRLARIGFLCNCVLPVTLNSTKVRHHRIDDKAYEGDEKKLTSQANNVAIPSTSSSSSSSSPSGPTTRRGRSRTRRAHPPSSPLIVGSSS
ncbi:putative PPPDE putative peptidase domain-containing protein [Rosa chinensis]|uniref:Putative PPPDE putative peptidase domain-containing protein n=1 Tax=Rosa chinensis TaxID=74649 RepID=A0A2P6RVK0_ROSCH|nr:deSI-like protein At4g17486 [Rosa chinensis]PRQ50457.1 putative PPPDE putative peptidase domain-containing protein [Rosa chinensis]